MIAKRIAISLILIAIACVFSKSSIFQKAYEIYYRFHIAEEVKIGCDSSFVDKRLQQMSIEHSEMVDDDNCISCNDKIIQGIVRDTTYSMIGSYSVMLVFHFDIHGHLTHYDVSSDSVSI